MTYLKYFIFIITILSTFPASAILWTEGINMPRLLALFLLLITLGTLSIGIYGFLQPNKFLIACIIAICLNISILFYAASSISSSINQKISITETDKGGSLKN